MGMGFCTLDLTRTMVALHVEWKMDSEFTTQILSKKKKSKNSLKVASDMWRCFFVVTTLLSSEEERNPSTHLIKS